MKNKKNASQIEHLVAGNVAKNIVRLMKENNLTIEEFSIKTNMPCKRIAKILNKEAKKIFPNEVYKITGAFNLPIDAFVGHNVKKTTSAD